MNLELNGHKITLGPKALAFIETNMRGMGETYCRDQLALWLAGGKVDADVTIEGPARFVAVGNEIGIPKAGADVRREASPQGKAGGTTVPGDAAPADSEWPKWLRYGINDTVVLCADATDGGIAYCRNGRTFREDDKFSDRARYDAIITQAEATAFLRANGHAKVADELERQAPPVTGLQVWRAGEWIDIRNGYTTVAYKHAHKGSWQPMPESTALLGGTLVTGPEADAAIEEAKKQGVI